MDNQTPTLPAKPEAPVNAQSSFRMAAHFRENYSQLHWAVPAVLSRSFNQGRFGCTPTHPACKAQPSEAIGSFEKESRILDSGLTFIEGESRLQRAISEWHRAQEFPKRALRPESISSPLPSTITASAEMVDPATADWLESQEFPIQPLVSERQSPVQDHLFSQRCSNGPVCQSVSRWPAGYVVASLMAQ